MSIPSVNTQLSNTNVQSVGNTQSTTGTDKPASNSVSAKNQLDAQLVQSLDVSLDSGQKGLSLVYRKAIDSINQILAQSLAPGQNAAGSDASTGAVQGGQQATPNILQQKLSEDNSPEATAQRILSGALGFFGAYAKQNPNDDPQKQASDFVDLVRGGFEKGFAEASGILKDLKVLNGSVAEDVQKTYDLVSKGFDNFLASQAKASNSSPPTSSLTNA
ncbi:DUF5610 domain-containing protein [Neisseriaceae bacterium TC5R-5]|nr:DUF5610 domain-containing protein [Neisseriaceae bacterium TC5R-5]